LRFLKYEGLSRKELFEGQILFRVGLETRFGLNVIFSPVSNGPGCKNILEGLDIINGAGLIFIYWTGTGQYLTCY
jgi:hypothetical protein